MTEWSREKPEPPSLPPSDWYWYWDNSYSEPWIVEVWPSRWLGHMDGAWGPRIIGRPTNPPGFKEWKKKTKDKADDSKSKPKKRKRAPKPKRKDEIE